MNLDDTSYLSNYTKPITNQINKYNHNTTILFFNPDATSFFLLYYCGKKRTIKGDNKRKYKRNKGKGTSSQNSGRERRIFLFVFHSLLTTVDYREAGLLITFLIILLFSHYFTFVIPLYYPFYNNIIPLFLFLYIINMRVEKSGVSFTYCFELKTMILRQD